MTVRALVACSIVVSILVMSGCTAPSDVEANRRITAATTSQTDSLLLSNSTHGNLGTIGLRDQSSLIVDAQNLATQKALIIFSVALENGNQGFILSGVKVPDTLDVKQSTLSQQHYTIQFVPPGIGTFQDALIVNGDTANRFPLRAVVVDKSTDTLNIDDLDTLSHFRVRLVNDSAAATPGLLLMAVELGRQRDTTIVIENLSTTHRLRIPALALTGDSDPFSLNNLPALPLVLGKKGESTSMYSMSLRFKPTSVFDDRQAAIRFGSTAKNDFVFHGRCYRWDTIAVDKRVNLLLIDRGPLNFDSVVVGSSLDKQFMISNLGTVTASGGSWLSIPKMTIEGADTSDFSIVTPMPIIIAPSSSTFCTVRFHPHSTGSKSAAIKVGTTQITINALGVGRELRADTVSVDSLPTRYKKTFSDTLDFGQLGMGAEVTQGATIRNPINAYVRIDKVTETSLNNGDEFTVTTPLNASIILAPGASLNVSVKFKPLRSGAAAKRLQFGNNPSNSLIITGVIQ